MKRTVQWLVGIVVALSLVMFAGTAYAKKKHKHHDAHSMSKEKLKKEGRHEVHKNGKHTASADVKGGKISGFHVKHDTKGEVAVKKVKSKKKIALIDVPDAPDAPVATDTTYAYDGYCYDDDDGDENCYWYPVEVVTDDFTGAVEYVEAID